MIEVIAYTDMVDANAVNDVVKAVAEGSDEFVEVEDSAQA